MDPLDRLAESTESIAREVRQMRESVDLDKIAARLKVIEAVLTLFFNSAWLWLLPAWITAVSLAVLAYRAFVPR